MFRCSEGNIKDDLLGLKFLLARDKNCNESLFLSSRRLPNPISIITNLFSSQDPNKRLREHLTHIVSMPLDV